MLCLPLLSMEERKESKMTLSSPRVAVVNMLCALLKGLNSNSLPFVRILINLSITKLNYFVQNIFDIEQQYHFMKLLNCLISNNLIAPLISSHDIIYLTEINKKAIEISFDSEILHSWSEFALTLGLLPDSNIEIIMSVLNDALILRLQMSFGSHCSATPSLLSSIFICVTKLTVFYLASKSNLFSNNTQLKNSVSCLLNEAKTESNSALASVKLASVVNMEDFEKILCGFFSAYVRLIDYSKNDMINESSDWNQCLIVLRDSCNLLYYTNSSLISELLLSLFTKHCNSEDGSKFYNFSVLFYGEEASDFIRTTISMFKTPKETWKNHEILLKFLLQYSKYESDDVLISEIWTILMGQIKDFSSSGFKYKSVLWLLIEICCHLMEKLDHFDSNRIVKDFVRVFMLFN